jgi:hypothetical protein
LFELEIKWNVVGDGRAPGGRRGQPRPRSTRSSSANTRATNAAQIDAACAAGAEAVQIFTQAPNTAAFTDLLNRALDKPTEQIQLTGEEGGPVVHTFRWQT